MKTTRMKAVDNWCKLGWHDWADIKTETSISMDRSIEQDILREMHLKARIGMCMGGMFLTHRFCVKCGKVENQIDDYREKMEPRIRKIVGEKLKAGVYSNYELTGEFPLSVPPPRKKD